MDTLKLHTGIGQEKSRYNTTAMVITVLITAGLPLWRCVWILPEISQSVYYAGFAFLSIMVVFSGRSKIHWSVIWMLCCCVASILLNTFPPYFTPWPRLLSLTLIILCVGPMLTNRVLLPWRQKALTAIMWGFVVITLISCLLYYVLRAVTLYQDFLFIGITTNSMLMSPIAAVSALFMLQRYIPRWKAIKWSKRIVVSAICIVCVLSAVLAGSRSALISFGVAFVVWLWFYIGSFKRFMGVMSLIIAAAVITSPLWWSYTETIEKKMENNAATGGFITARQSLWEQRWVEFMSKPLFGIGFSKVDRDQSNEDTSKFSGGKNSGIVEPGNGWLFVLSSTGIGGFCFICWIYFSMLWKLIRLHTYKSIFILSILIFIGVHNFAEGYIFSSGNLFCLIFWLCLGIAACLPTPQNLKYYKGI